jgi:hypothetical protein
MPASLTMYPERGRPLVRVVRSTLDGQVQAYIETDELHFCLFGLARDVADLLQAFARAATDEALAIEAEQCNAAVEAVAAGLPVVEDVKTGRLQCCGAGTDQRDTRTGERLHLIGCPVVARPGLDACREALSRAGR